MVDTYDWYLLPVHNPDGYEYSRDYVRINKLTVNRTKSCEALLNLNGPSNLNNCLNLNDFLNLNDLHKSKLPPKSTQVPKSE